MPSTTDKHCPCGSGKRYDNCCGLYHSRRAVAPTAEALMRSRYVAYVRGDAKYLYRSWDEQTRPSLQSLRSMPPVEWLGLTIRHIEAGTGNDDKGAVSFVARFVQGGQVGELAEVSRFRRVSGKWVYVGGEAPPSVVQTVSGSLLGEG